MNAFESQYTIIEKIGEGGMGTVYLANDTMLDRKVAIKQLNKSANEDESLGDRFQQEALALAKLNHPNITHLYSFIPKEDTYWMVMEYVEGKTLEDWLRIHKKITHPLAASIAVQMLDGLHHAHKKGIIHRDIKPANVMIHEDGEVKIMDFGIARMRDAQRMTRHGKSVGTLEYMSPEQIQGQEGDERTDVYAVGNILYELLCGMPPYQADTDYQIMKDKLENDPKPVIAFNPSVPVTLQKIIFKALERKPERRYQKAVEFKEELKKAMGSLLLSDSELTQVLKASQVFTAPRTGSEPMSVSTLLAKAKTISGSLKVPDIEKVNKPVLLLAASVLLCVILLLWNFAGGNSEESKDVVQDPVILEQPDTSSSNELQQNIATTASVEETPNEMYQRINKQNAAANARQDKTRQSENAQKKTSNRKAVEAAEYEDEAAEEYRGNTRQNSRAGSGPVEVPAGRSIRITLAETISSEDVSRDGDIIRLTCAENVEAAGRLIIRKGAAVTGKIVDVIPSRNERKKALIGFIIQKVQAVDGSDIKLRSDRYRLFAEEPGYPVSYRNGQSFRAELGRGKVR
ncbi:MAG TPA: serine/threonine-protein kinase [Flavipsychrobacter sp.]|nr:serine/threonine-protein kinase [Flavipsychrobacter sp.]